MSSSSTTPELSNNGITPTSVAPQSDDMFQLYDLKVEVVVEPDPSGHENTLPRLLCGAHIGDYFTLQGEMLYLPPGQGISIYSLGKLPKYI